MTDMTRDDLLPPAEVARILGIEPSTLQTWRRLRKGPPWVRVAHRTVRYPRTALEQYLAERAA